MLITVFVAHYRCPRERLQAVALGGRWRKQHCSAKGSHLPCLPASAGGTAVRPRPLGHTQHTHLYTNPEQQTQYITFLCKGWIHTPAVHSLLLLLAGDIETNPGPTQYPCPVCSRAYSKRRGAILCVECTGWVCYTKTCSGIANRGHVPQGWKCKRCTLGTTPKHNNNIHSQTGPTSSAGHVDTTTTAPHSTAPIPIKNPTTLRSSRKLQLPRLQQP